MRSESASDGRTGTGVRIGAPASGGARLHLHGVRREFRRDGSASPLVALTDIDLTVQPGEFVAVVGPSGCGKTTLLRLIAGMLETSAGSVVVDSGGRGEARTGFVFQHSSLFPWRTVERNVTFGTELRARHPRRRDRRRAALAHRARELTTLVGLAGFEGYFPHQISGGMQQRVNLARALAIEPQLLLMDEPFGALDAQTREELQIELQRIAVEANTTIVFVTHDITEAVFLADRVVVLSGRPGRVKRSVPVPTSRPRELTYQVSDEFMRIRNHVWELVHGA